MARRKICVIGLTGSIGMGKSTALKMFSARGLWTLSADNVVHRLYGPDGAATTKIAKLFPSVVGSKGVNRRKLASIILDDEDNMKRIEALIHPLVFRTCRAFVDQARVAKAKGVVLDIPLLFETGYASKCDVTVCVSATARIQKERVLARKGMTAAKLRALLKKQMPDKDKRDRADYIIRSDRGMEAMRQQVFDLCDTLFH